MLRILYLEDNKIDARLIQHVLKADGVEASFHIVGSRSEFEEAVEDFSYDLVLADYRMPDLNALEAIHFLRSRAIDVPILLVSGAISGESAVEVLKAGATDYILKDHLARLAPAALRAVEEDRKQKQIAAHELEIQKTNTILSQAESLGQLGAFEWDFVQNNMTWTPGMYLIFETKPDEFVPTIDNVSSLVHPEDLTALTDKIMRIGKEQGTKDHLFSETFRLHIHGSKLKYVNSRGEIFLDQNQSPIRMVGVIQDVSQQVEAEEAIHKLNEELEQKVHERTRELASSEQKYRLISDNITDLVSLHTADAKFIYLSKSVKDILGFMPEELLHTDPGQLVHPDDYDRVLKEVLWAMNMGFEQFTIESRMKNQIGMYVWIESRLRVSREKGKLAYIQASSRDITQRKRSEQQMEKALQRERELNELRTQFVSMASHQFRTPLSIIRSNVELLELLLENINNPQKSGKYQEIIQRLNGEVDHLTALMDDILEMGRVDAGKVSPVYEEVDLTDLVKELLVSEYGELKTHEHPRIFVKGDIYPIQIDRRLISHALINLISNAMKYSQGKPSPEIHLNFTAEQAQVKIKDHGIGIPFEEQEKLFESWYRASNTGNVKGTGLGLAISKEFIEANKGKINFESELGKGSVFTVSFPGRKVTEA